MGYPGGKNGDGVFQKIISYMPPHRVYIEPFVGGGAILRLKKPAELSLAGDLDAEAVLALAATLAPEIKTTLRESLNLRAIARASSDPARGSAPLCWLYTGDGIALLERYPFQGDELVYCDPPYPHSTRSRRDLYRYEMSDADHERLLAAIQLIPARVMISSYWSKLYARALKDWFMFRFNAVNRAGKIATEHVWTNFPEPVELHDYRYLGANFRERERIKRKKARWTAKLRRMPTLERRALLAAIDEAWR